MARYYAYAGRRKRRRTDFMNIDAYRYIAAVPMTDATDLTNEVSILDNRSPWFESEGRPIRPTKHDWLIVPQMYTKPCFAVACAAADARFQLLKRSAARTSALHPIEETRPRPISRPRPLWRA